jgi:phosphopantetheine adenylyltransferase
VEEGGIVHLAVKTMDIKGEMVDYTYQATGGTFDTLETGEIVWRAPQVDEPTDFIITVTGINEKGEQVVKKIKVTVLPSGEVIVRQDTTIRAGQVLAMDTGDMPLSGKKIGYSYQATGGTFDTLANGEVVWRAPQVEKPTTFIVTIEATNEKGEKALKKITVTVYPEDIREVQIKKDTTVTAGDTLALLPQELKLPGKKITYAYHATGGAFDTLANGKVVWRAPLVGKPATFTITVEATDEKGNQALKQVRVRVRPGKFPRQDSTYTITGTVRNSEGKPLLGVTVLYNNQEYFTDENGQYTMKGIPRRVQALVQYRARNYERLTSELSGPREGDTLVRDVTMRIQAIRPPTGLKARAVPDTVHLSWEPNKARHMYGYNIYRSINEYTGYTKINTKPLAFEKFIDTAVKDSIRYYYKISSVNIDEVEGDLSDYVQAIVPIKLFAVKDVYNSPYTNPTGIVYDGHTIWSCDNLRGEIYKHDWDLKVVKTYKSPGASPTGLTWDGKHLWSCDYKKRMIYQHGSKLNVIKKFKGPGYNLTDLAWDGQHLWVANSGGKLFKIDTNGKTVAEYKSPYSLFTGLAWDGKQLWVCSIHTKKIYKLDRKMNVADSYESPYLLSNGFAWDGKHFWACGKVTEKVYKFEFD